MTYSELQVTTHFSFLRGVSSPEQLFSHAAVMGMPALGIVDRNSVGGVVRALVAAEEVSQQGFPMRMIAGCRLDLVSGASVLVWPEDRAAWGRLTRLLTLGKSRADPQKGEKGKCFLHWEDLAASSDGLVAALVPEATSTGDASELQWMADIFGYDGHVALTHQRRPNEKLRLHQLAEHTRRFGLKPLATGDVLYHHPDKRMLQDVVTAIREKCTVDDLGYRRERSADRYLKSPQDIARRFAAYPEALFAVEAVVERCTFSLRELKYQYPDEIILNGRSPQDALERLTRTALQTRFNGNPPAAYSKQLEHELALVADKEYAPYFLTVNSIMSFARAQKILCQGRGSAANSIICYVLGITSIDPVHRTLLFERFISPERREPPDIDVDFEHERREEVIQWIYETYGNEHAALTAVVSRFRSRGAIREVGKALGLSEDLTAALAGQVWGVSHDGIEERHTRTLGLDMNDKRIALAIELANELKGTPRHLSQHPGGFILSRDRLDSLLPIEPAAMDNRRVVEWEKLDIEELGMMKVDILGLGMLGCMRRTFDLMLEHKGQPLMSLASPAFEGNDGATFDMICQADTLGVFQIESRAQMSMLPRMQPREFYDLVIEVAIVRPGPIQGNMVHPYLKRREGKEKVEYPTPELEAVLKKTLGVPLFQEQAMQVAIEGAGFTKNESDRLRRAMATFKADGTVGEFRPKLIEGMTERGISLDFAERMVAQIEGFANYGFPESHAASFAKIAYASCWMKAHHPDVFCTALLNAQPMGFYAPAQIVRDAQEHGVVVHPPCINASDWDTLLERRPAVERPKHARFWGTDAEWRGLQPLRLGLRIVSGLSSSDATAIMAARVVRPFTSVEDVWRRSGIKRAAIEKLASADAFHVLGLDRRQALWAVRALGEKPTPLDFPERREPGVTLTPLTDGREVVEDYRATQLSLRAHPLKFLRDRLDLLGVIPAAEVQNEKLVGKKVEVAGVILVRQRPGSAKGVLFITIEDETGIANAILWPDRFEAQRRTVMSATMIGVQGTIQREGIVIHIVADRIIDYSPMLREVGAIDLPRLTSPGDGATHGGSPDRGDPGWKPKLRSDYHFREKRDDDTSIPIKSHDFH